MKTSFKFLIASSLLAVVFALIAGCASDSDKSHPERSLQVGDVPTNSNTNATYKVSRKQYKMFNYLYAPVSFDSAAYYRDYDIAGRTRYDTNLADYVSQTLQGTNNPAALSNINAIIKTKLKNQRNDFVFKYMKIISRNYGDYVAKITGYKAELDVASDAVILGGNAVAALTPAASTKTAWNVAIAACLGLKLSYDKNVFLNQSVLLLAAKMEQNRVQERELIKGKMTNSFEAYPLSEAALDLEDLYQAGTLIKVLQNIALNAPATTNMVLTFTNLPAGAILTPMPPAAPATNSVTPPTTSPALLPQKGASDSTEQLKNALSR